MYSWEQGFPSAPRQPKVYVPCACGQAPHKFSAWKLIVTKQGRIEYRICTECGHREDAKE